MSLGSSRGLAYESGKKLNSICDMRRFWQKLSLGIGSRDVPLHGTGGVVGARGGAGHDRLRRLRGGGRAAERHVALGLDCKRRRDGLGMGMGWTSGTEKIRVTG